MNDSEKIMDDMELTGTGIIRRSINSDGEIVVERIDPEVFYHHPKKESRLHKIKEWFAFWWWVATVLWREIDKIFNPME